VNAPSMTADWTVEAGSDTEALWKAREIARAYVMPASISLARLEWEGKGLVIITHEADGPAWWACSSGPFERFVNKGEV
jgi:hypothetical protein